MTQYANLKRDEKICHLVFDKGLAPKEVFRKLELPNVHIVYRVLKKFYAEHKRKKTQIHANDFPNVTA